MTIDFKSNIKLWNILIWVVSAVVFLLVLMMRRYKIETGIDFGFLPPFYSSLNALCAIFLIFGFLAIKKGKVSTHKRWMLAALYSSVLFLLCYVVYHFTTPETLFCRQGKIRIVYFVFLITHIILAAVLLPFILKTLLFAATDQIDKHKKMAKFVFPLWLYVALSGPICYLMLYPCY